MDTQKLKECIANFSKLKILVVGDVVLDHYISGEIKRLNPEEYGSPLLDVEKHYDVIGCAGNTANNISKLGATSYLYSIIGDDIVGKEIIQLVNSNGVVSRISVINNRISSKKTRLIANSRKRQIARYDEETKAPLTKEQTKSFLKSFNESDLNEADAYLISDYAKGLINKDIVDFLKKEAKKRKKILLAQPKPQHLDIYREVDIMINKKEAYDISPKGRDLPLDILGKEITHKNKSNVIITYGKEGMGYYGKKGSYLYAPTKEIEAYDETGAGDTAFAVICLSLASKLSITDSMDLANHASGVVVRKIGTSTLTQEELIRSYD